jgi:hypothetical protein
VHPADWITLLATVTAMISASAGAIVKLTRLVTAVEQLGETLKGIVTTIAEHERRLGHLERGSWGSDPGRRRPPW